MGPDGLLWEELEFMEVLAFYRIVRTLQEELLCL